MHYAVELLLKLDDGCEVHKAEGEFELTPVEGQVGTNTPYTYLNFYLGQDFLQRKLVQLAKLHL